MTADPRLVPTARTIPEISYREVAELAYYGAESAPPQDHPAGHRGPYRAASLQYLQSPTIPVRAWWLLQKKTRHSESPFKNGIKAVTVIRSLHMITIEGRGMLGVPGVAARAFGAVAKTGTSVPLISQASSEQSICFAVPSDSTKDVIEALKKAFQAELGQPGYRQHLAQRRSRHRHGGCRRDARYPRYRRGASSAPWGMIWVNILAIAQGSSEGIDQSHRRCKRYRARRARLA